MSQDIHLQILDGPGPASTTRDLVVGVEPVHLVGELARAIANYFGWPDAAQVRLIAMASGLSLDPEQPLAHAGLLSGQCLRLVRWSDGVANNRVPAWRGDTAGDGSAGGRSVGRSHQGLVLVRSGPDAGRRMALRASRAVIGRDRTCPIRLDDPRVSRRHIVVRRTANGYSVRPTPEARSPVTVNGLPITATTMVAGHDLIGIGTTTISVVDQRRVRPPGLGDHFGTVPFHRTPYHPTPIAGRVFDPIGDLPEEIEPVRFPYLGAIVPVLMGTMMALLFSPRFLLFAALGPIVTGVGFLEQRRRNAARYARAEERFERKLAARRVEIAGALQHERATRFVAAPDLLELAARARHRSSELWIRDRSAPDVLVFRLGLGDVDAKVAVRAETRGAETLRETVGSELAEIERIHSVPITVDAGRHSVVGLVGASADVVSVVSSLLCQTACLHSPDDVLVFAALDPSCRAPDWLKWLPHTRPEHSPLPCGALATNSEQTGRLLRDLLAVAEQRVSQHQESAGPSMSGRQWPRLVVAVDRRLDPDPAVVSRLGDLAHDAGITMLWLTTSRDRVPRQAEVVISCEPATSGQRSRVSFTDPAIASQSLDVDRLPADVAEEIAMSLAAVSDASTASASVTLPREVTLFEALGTDAVDGAWVQKQWQVDRGYSLPGPIGVCAGGPLVLDLVVHGPHALVGGTSGAGKSELLISLVGGLAAQNPPTKLNFLFVDYKGGATSSIFKELPHTGGCVTNLDAAVADRALRSLRAELNRRMDLFEGRAKDLAELIEHHPHLAPPSLVIVIDEFATLVSEVPDFLAGVVDIAQRGRSLGIHLVLATQRPSGAVNENILANTNLRISLRMLDAAESRHVIGGPEAAGIPTLFRGRGFARFGPGELVAFQGAWSGAIGHTEETVGPISVADFVASFEPSSRRKPEPAAVGPSGEAPGQGQLGDSRPPTLTQLDRLLAAIGAAAETEGCGPARAAWLEELPEAVTLRSLPSLARGGDGSAVAANADADRWPVAIGLLDEPDLQRRSVASLDLASGGGLLVFGTSGSGKTTTLRTLAQSACRSQTSGRSRVSFVVLDFASRHLADLEGHPDCAAIATGDDLEATTRVIVDLSQLLADRRSQVAATTRAGGDSPRFDRVLLLIDDYASLSQTFEGVGTPSSYYLWLEALHRLVVDGRQVGIHTAITAARRAAIKPSLLSAISNRIILRQADMSGFTEFGVPSSAVSSLELNPGRGFINGTTVVQVATESPNESGLTSGDQPISVHPEGPRAGLSDVDGPARLISRALSADIDPLDKPDKPLEIAIGRSDMGSEPVVVDLSANDLVIVGSPRSGRSTALLTVGQQLLEGGCEVWVIGPVGSPLDTLETARVTFGKAQELVPSLHELADLLDGLSQNPTLDQIRDVVLLIDDYDLLEDPVLDQPMGRLLSAGVRFVASTTELRSYSANAFATEMRKSRAILYLQPAGDRQLAELTGTTVRLRPGLPLPAGRGVLLVNRAATVVQVANAQPR